MKRNRRNSPRFVRVVREYTQNKPHVSKVTGCNIKTSSPNIRTKRRRYWTTVNRRRKCKFSIENLHFNCKFSIESHHHCSITRHLFCIRMTISIHINSVFIAEQWFYWLRLAISFVFTTMKLLGSLETSILEEPASEQLCTLSLEGWRH
jgi:hypothetical protein